jgi:plastocyanin
MKKVFLYISIGLILLAVPITVFVAGQRQELRKKAAPASTLSFSPSTQTVKEGEKFTLDIKIDTATNQVGVVQLRIVYDPAFLEAEEITNGPLAPSIHASKKIEPNGKVSISVGARDTLHPIVGSGTIAILSMKSLKASATPLSIRFTPSPDTAANGIGEGQNDVVIGRNSATVTILNADGTPGTAQPNQQQQQSAAPSPSATPIPTPTPAVINFGGSAGFTYSPSQITIKKGESVTWRGPFATHPLVSVNDVWAEVKTGTEFTHTFTAAGTYDFFCEAHGNATSGMKGQIVVTDSIPTPSPTGGSTATLSAILITSETTEEGIATASPTFKGKGVPGSTITLTIHSEPRTVVVTVDANGNWVYTPETPLEEGPHTITALVTDPQTGQTQTSTATFVVASAGTGGSDTTASAIPVSGSVHTTIALITLGLLLLTSGVFMPRILH